MYLVLLMPLFALALLFQEASAPLGPPDFAGAEATSTYVANHYWPGHVLKPSILCTQGTWRMDDMAFVQNFQWLGIQD